MSSRVVQWRGRSSCRGDAEAGSAGLSNVCDIPALARSQRAEEEGDDEWAPGRAWA